MEMNISAATAGYTSAPAGAEPGAAGPIVSDARALSGSAVSFAGMLVQVLGGQAMTEGAQTSSAASLLIQLMRPGTMPDGQWLPAEWQALQEQLVALASENESESAQALNVDPELLALLSSVLALLQPQNGAHADSAEFAQTSGNRPWTAALLADNAQLADRVTRLLQEWRMAVAGEDGHSFAQASAGKSLQNGLAEIARLLEGAAGGSGRADGFGQPQAAAGGDTRTMWNHAVVHGLRDSKHAASSAGSDDTLAQSLRALTGSGSAPSVAATQLLGKPVYSFQVMQAVSEAVTADGGATVVSSADSVANTAQMQTDAGALARGSANEPLLKEAPPAPVPANRFADALSEMAVKNFRVLTANGVTEAKITLIPEHLGQVDVRLTMQNGQLTAQLVTETIAGKDALETQINQLRAALQNQGVQVEKIVVTHSPFSGFAHQFQEQRHQQFGRQGEDNKKNKLTAVEGDTADFAQELESERDGYSSRWSSSSFETSA